MKIATYNVENLFDRAKALNEESAEAQRVIREEAELSRLLEEPEYTPAVKARMLELLESLGILRTDNGRYVILRKIRGQFIKRPRNGKPEIVANGRSAWIGWVELKTEHVNETAILNTGRVIRDVNADVVAVIEVEHRVALKQFSDNVLVRVGGRPYSNIMLIDGNDERGIDVGLMTKEGFDIGLMRSHIHDLDQNGKPIFSRDCPEYCVRTPSGEVIWFLPNHFKSKFGGNDYLSQNKRAEQSRRTAEIYRRLLSEGFNNIVVLGDLNDTPDSEPLRSLLCDTDLKDVSMHPAFDPGEFSGVGTFGLGNDKDKIDYLLLSPALYQLVSCAGIFRMGAWPGKRPKRWTVYEELKEVSHVASDHHLLWCTINL